ncbi:MAG: ketol-acid reductoisomerase, partial [SAR202 cluster bacterium]|nr:ketol-acid reductoisomerase [SAR202 cluster bacterium]
MPAKIYYDKDTDISLIKNKTIGIIGYGSQGHAHALNLKDSGMNVVVGLYRGSKSWSKAEQDGLKVAEVADVAKQADTLMMLVPDMAQRDVYRQSIAPNVRQGQTL